MDSKAHEAYLETEIRTATPQRLRLMLIDGAIRFASKTIELWQQDLDAQAIESLDRCRGVVSELLINVTPNKSELGQQIATVYVYLFQLLSEAQLHRSQEKIDDAIKILQEERTTWMQVCEQYPNWAPADSARQPQEITANGTVASAGSPDPGPSFSVGEVPNTPPLGLASSGGFSLEA